MDHLPESGVALLMTAWFVCCGLQSLATAIATPASGRGSSGRGLACHCCVGLDGHPVLLLLNLSLVVSLGFLKCSCVCPSADLRAHPSGADLHRWVR